MAWSNGLAQWDIGETTYISIAFTWRLNDAYQNAQFAKALGRKVSIGGPALFLNQMRHKIVDVADSVGGDYPEAVTMHNKFATFASRGCPVGCWFCIVPAMEGKEFTLIPDFKVRPILCDNNLSALPVDYQNHIISRYNDEGIKLKDANSGFEPRTFTTDVYSRWKDLVNSGGGPWRFALDDMDEINDAVRVMRMLEKERRARKRVYTLIGNEPFDDCMYRIKKVIDLGCDPYAQPLMKLNAMDKSPWVKFDWTEQLLADVARWVNGWVWKKAEFGDYSRSKKSPFLCEHQKRLF